MDAEGAGQRELLHQGGAARLSFRGGTLGLEGVLREIFPIESFDIIAGEPTVARLKQAGRLTTIPAEHHIVDSIAKAAATTGFPLIVTTADNVLMTPEALRRLADEGQRGGADALAVMARAEDIIAVHPEGGS